MKQPIAVPRIETLRRFVVNHRHIYFRDHVNHLSKWVRRITSQSHLEHLELAMDDLEYFRGPYSNYGGLVEHISYRHGRTIRVLRLTHGYVDSATVALLCQKCPHLEDVSLGVNVDTLVRDTLTPLFSFARLDKDLSHSANSLKRPPLCQSYDRSSSEYATSRRTKSQGFSPMNSRQISSRH